MKVLCITRLFSGFETSIQSGKWEPTGVPTIYKLIEVLSDKTNDLILVWTCKDIYSSWKETRNHEFKLEGLKADVRVLAGYRMFPRFLGRKVRYLFRELHHFLYVCRLVLKEKPDLLYIDHANVYSAALFSRLTSIPVVFRVMGVYPAMKQTLRRKRLIDFFLRRCYRSPFAAVICTQDGSGIEPWLEKAIRKTVKVHALINGVDLVNSKYDVCDELRNLPKNTTVVLFVGKLEPAKGAMEFARAFIELHRKYPGKVHALIVGQGSLSSQINNEFKEWGVDNCTTIINRLPHRQILHAHSLADIYVSLNQFGNLSVANLEAMKMGQCMVFPESQPDTAIDLITDRWIAKDAALRIPAFDDLDGLFRALEALHLNPEKRKMYSKGMLDCSTFIPTWEQRIAEEYCVIRSLVKQ